ncbi:MAG TPA: cupin domain-containing protein [Polyangiales bacterium]|nr:cupin domain-containing protein [Polyangiales bacterium]
MSQQIHHDGLGGSITILEHGDAVAPMRFRMCMPRGFGPPAAERHPRQREEFRVLRGTLDLGIIDGARVLLRAGDTFSLPAGKYHRPLNGGDDELEFEATLTPGLDAAEMFASLYAATREHAGIARFVQVAGVFQRHSATLTFAWPVQLVMRFASTLFGPARSALST